MLRYVGVSSERAVRLREMAELGCAIALEREARADGHLCVIRLADRRVIGRGPTADAAVASALAMWDDDGAES